MTRHMGYYVLDADGRPLPLEDQDTLVWAQWYESHDRRLAVDELDTGVRVSTVFLALDHAFLPSDEPFLWETLIFGGPHNGRIWRYASREAALAGHAEAVALAAQTAQEPR